MNVNALAVANYFVEKKCSESGDLTLIRLIKYVYISYGFALAALDKSILDPRFDKVEAWKYGPVIPSVYHSFKHFEKKQITQETQIIRFENGNNIEFETPKLDREKDSEICEILDFVWRSYKDNMPEEIIELLHRPGTPWKYCYVEDQNVEIPREMTKAYYAELLKSI